MSDNRIITSTLDSSISTTFIHYTNAKNKIRTFCAGNFISLIFSFHYNIYTDVHFLANDKVKKTGMKSSCKHILWVNNLYSQKQINKNMKTAFTQRTINAKWTHQLNIFKPSRNSFVVHLWSIVCFIIYFTSFLAPMQTAKAYKGAIQSTNHSPVQPDDKNPDVVPLGKGNIGRSNFIYHKVFC